MKPLVFFITGTSGSGKSTLVENLHENLSYVEVHDFDEGGVPPNADEKWRRDRTDSWLKKAKEYAQDGKSTIICGVSVPSEIKNSSEYDNSLNMHYGFIHIDSDEIKKRLSSRNWDAKEIQDNINWAKHIEAEVLLQEDYYVVDGVKNNALEVADKFIEWIEKKR
ncbi:AAA family ATPase [Candidatus Woesearchaeota archaeon]|jgi:broad-specificity NMP kinase|nr:AAA family ATPase [Candidatus Woesearchaeota archaeon]MBT6520076.1 AAA family ATPase [Candidatus Woesearchaeota archaeon]MBT7366681.1 AAA family ATPase [Candidatus Woesearchaeota archaeon]